MKKYESKFEEADKWYALDNNATKKLSQMGKPFSSSIRKNEKLGSSILKAIVTAVKSEYGEKLSFQEVFYLIKEIAKDTSIDDFNWDDNDLKTQIEQNL